MKLFTFIFSISFIIFLSYSFSQNAPETNRKLDSLNQVISDQSSHDTSIVKAYIDMGMTLYLKNIDTLPYLCEKAIVLIDKYLIKKNSKEVEVTLKRLKADALISIGYVKKYHGDIAGGLSKYNEGLKLNKEIGDKKGIGNANLNIGVVYFKLGDIPKALNAYFEALKNYEQIDHTFGMGYVYNHIGTIQFQQKDYPSAILNFKKSLEYRKKLDDKYGMSTTYTNLGNISTEQGNYNDALKYIELGLNLRKEIGDKDGIASSYMSLGKLYSGQNNIDMGLEYYFKGLDLYKEVEDQYQVSSSMVIIGNVYLKNQNQSLAKSYGIKALTIAEKIGYPDNIESAANLLSKVYSKNRNYKKAYEMRNLEIKMSDSLNNKASLQASAKQEAKYKYEKQAATDSIKNAEAIKIQDAEIAIEKAENKSQKQQKYYLYGGLALALVFGVVVFNRFRATRKQKGIIEKQKETVDKAFVELEEKNTEIMDSISYAKRIQNAILPPSKLIEELLPSSFIHYKPKDIVAGDFYWIETTDSGVLFAAADCTGHGVPGAMVSVICNNGLNRSVREYGLMDPGEILNKTREIVIQEFEKSEDEVKDGMDIALCKLKNNILEYAGANNPLWIIRKDGTEIQEIKANKQPIGKFVDPVPYTTHKVELFSGDSFYIFSDGYPDQFGGEKGKKFKSGNFKKLLLSIHNEDLNKQEAILNKTFEDWKGDLEQIDDVCVIGIRV